jgi:hypothetical protein
MVLKLGAGKIQKTWKLWWASGCQRFRSATARVRADPAAEAASTVRLSKIVDYLLDNPCVIMLSQVKGWDQGESGRAAGTVPNWESSAHPSAGDAEKDGAAANVPQPRLSGIVAVSQAKDAAKTGGSS